jgi:hypothetical protein
MTELVWDQIEDRKFQTGIERGVLHSASDATMAWTPFACLLHPAVAWNGLVSVVESPSRESKVYYQDGVKALERFVSSSYSAKIQAFTYPDVLEELMGNRRMNSGVYLHDQREALFHLAYRTRVGSAQDGVDYGYKLHLVYNLLINPGDVTFNSISDQIAPNTFEWTVTGTPLMWGAVPFNHISIDSRDVDPAWLAPIETDLYGTPTAKPRMPNPFPILDSLA